jgi:hypothetical protein
LFTSVAVVTHAPAHTVPPPGQTQAPAVQLAPVAHTVPHAPQLRTSVCKFAHPVPGHEVVPPVQLQ